MGPAAPRWTSGRQTASARHTQHMHAVLMVTRDVRAMIAVTKMTIALRVCATKTAAMSVAQVETWRHACSFAQETRRASKLARLSVTHVVRKALLSKPNSLHEALYSNIDVHFQAFTCTSCLSAFLVHVLFKTVLCSMICMN